VIDQYASSSGYVTATLGNVTFGYTGTHSVILTVTGENASSSGYAITADKFNFLALTSQASAPDFSLAAGYYATTQTVTISSTTSGATIRYTTDGSTPTEANGTVYSGPITLGSSTMLKAIAYGVGVADSSITSSAFMVVTPQPLLNVLCDVNPRFVGGTATAASGVVQGSDGSFYGIISQGGTAGDGSIFRMTPGGTMTILVTFTGANGAYPQGSLLLGTDGNFYGTTSSGGPNNGGTFFQMTPSGVLTTLFSFSGTNNAYPGPLTLERTAMSMAPLEGTEPAI